MKAGREDIERMDAYLANQLDDEARLLFDSKLATDDEFAEEFELHKMIVVGIAAEKEARFRAVLAQQREDTLIGANTWGKKFTMASAAIVLLGMAVVFYGMYRMNNPANTIAKADKVEERIEPTTQNEVKINKNNNAVADLNDKVEAEPPTDENSDEGEYKSLNEIVAIEDDSEEEESLEMDDSENTPAIVSPTAREDADLDEDIQIITEDKYIGKEMVAVNYSFDVNRTNAAPKAESLSNVQVTSIGKNKKTAKRKEADKRYYKDGETAPADSATKESKERVKVQADAKDTSTRRTEKILIEYYKSPLNYKGYTYNKRLKKIVVYGLSETKSSLKKYQNELYLKNGTSYYKMVPSTTYIRLNKVTNSLLITKLNQ